MNEWNRNIKLMDQRSETVKLKLRFPSAVFYILVWSLWSRSVLGQGATTADLHVFSLFVCCLMSCRCQRVSRRSIPHISEQIRYEKAQPLGPCSVNIYTVRTECLEEFCPAQLVFTHADSSLRPHPASRAHMVSTLKYVITARTKRHLITPPVFRLSFRSPSLPSHMCNHGLPHTRSIIMREFLHEIESAHSSGGFLLFFFAEPLHGLNFHPIFFFFFYQAL